MSAVEEARQYFSTRGVHEETYKRHQIEIVLNPSHDQLVGWLGSNTYCLEAAIVFPNLVPNPDDLSIGIHNYYIRCFPPPIWPDGKEHKFLCTLDSTYRPYVLPPVWDVAYEIDQPIYIVEKQTAALLLQQNGLHAIALDGTWGAAAKRGEGEKAELHPVLAEFHWTGRPVYLCFDSDFRSRQSVLWGLIRAYILLSIAGAIVRLIQWDPQFKGLEDLIAAKAEMDLLKQSTELDLLTATVSGLSASKAAKIWIIPQYRGLFEREIAVIRPGIDERSMLADCLHEALGTTAGDLKRSWKASAKEPDKEEKKSPCLPIPEPWPEPLLYSEVLDRILAEFLNPRFVVLSPEQAVVCSVHTLTTYLTDYLDDWLHFLYVTGGALEVGKTKLLKLFYYLCCHSVLQGDPTAASIYYRLKTDIYTIIVDEADKNEERKKAILDLINYSTSRDTAWVSRADQEGKKVIDYPTFCPKILAGIGPLRGTSESRCITIRMMRKSPGGPRIRITSPDKARFSGERSQLMRMATEIGPKIAVYDIDALKLPGGLSDREADNWTLLFSTVEMVGGHWPKLLRTAFHKLCPPKNSDEGEVCDDTELGEPLVRDIARIWKETPTQDFYGTEDLRRKLILMKERPWPNMRRGMGVSVAKIGALLSGFGLKSIQHEVLGERKRGYFLEAIIPLFRSHAADIWKFPPDGSGPPSDGGNSQKPGPSGGSPSEAVKEAASPVEPSGTGEKEKYASAGDSSRAPVRSPNLNVDNQNVNEVHGSEKESEQSGREKIRAPRGK